MQTNIQQVIKNKQERNNATFVITPNKQFYLYKGDRIKPKHFEMMLPVTILKAAKHID